MKKRIISLILVVALAFLTLTGCAYNYAKDDMSSYATLDTSVFYEALQALSIKDGDFGTDEAKRQEKLQDAIAAAILKITATDKKFAGKVDNFDSIYFCYMAQDEDGNIFYASKMDESKPTNFQLGLSTLEGLNKAIAEKLATIDDIKTYIYSTSAANVVSDGDVVSISYFAEWKEGDQTKTDVAFNEYKVIGTDELSKALIGAQVGVQFDNQVTVNVTEGEVTYVKNYSNLKVESIAQDNSTEKVEAGDDIFVSYNMSFDATPWFNAETGKYDLPEELTKNIKYEIDGEGRYKATVSYLAMMNITADVDGATDEQKTFEGQLVGKSAGSTTSTITVKNQQIGDKTAEVKYESVKVNWIINKLGESIMVEYTPYEEELKDDNSNKKTEKNIFGEEIVLNGKKLTYAICPIYYIDVENLSAEVIVREFYSVLNTKETAEHDHTEEDHEHVEEYIFAALNDAENKFTYAAPAEGEQEIGNKADDGKTIATLVGELVTLYNTLTEKQKTTTEALKALNTAQTNYAKDKGDSEAETASLKTKLENAETTYNTAKVAEDAVDAQIDEKIEAILACKKGETAVTESLVADYKDYQYDTLEDAYKADITEKLATEIIKALNKAEFKGNLPKKAVKNAYKAIMNTYKNDFYEGKYSSGSSSTSSTSTETNYKHYNGDFDAYLIDKVVSNKGDMKDVKASIQSQAEETVKDIILIYVLRDAVEERWADADVTLTKEEKKTLKKNLENTALLYQQYYGINYTYNVEDSYHASQFDKAMNYLLELADEVDGDLKVYFKHVQYTVEAANA